MEETGNPDPKTVFVVHGRNLAARDGMFDFLGSIGLKPLEWSQAIQMTGTGAPYIGEILDRAFAAAQAVVVLLTPDEITYIRREYATDDNDPDYNPSAQARPNVLFEAGMAFGRHPNRTILVEHGKVRPFSDVAGRSFVRLDNNALARRELAQRLESAGCRVDTSGDHWLTAGDLTPPPPPGAGLPLGRRVPNGQPSGLRMDARYLGRGKGNGTLQITNHSNFDILDLRFEVPAEAGPSFTVFTGDLPIKRLPPGKTASFSTSRSMAPGADHFEITVTGRTPDGTSISEQLFISLTA